MMRLQKSKSIRNLKISAPLSPLPPLPTDSFKDIPSTNESFNLSSFDKMTVPRSAPDSSVILMTKFDFKAENKYELTVGVGEAVKLLERKGNGWILVKPIGRLGDPGLIPASYVRIVRLDKEKSNSKADVNWLSQAECTSPKREKEISLSPRQRIRSQDQQTVQKLEQKQTPHSSTSSSMGSSQRDKYSSSEMSESSSDRSTREHTFFSMQTSSTSSEPVTPSEEPYPVSGLVRNANSYNGRYWYRVDIAMSDGKRRYLCRYYQDFYKLHCSLVDNCMNSKRNDQDFLIEQLPTLPDPIPRPDLQTLSNILLQRCQGLNVYIFKIVRNKSQLDYGDVLDEWVKPRLGDVELNEDTQLSNDSIEELLKPVETTTKRISKNKPQLTVQTAVTPPLPAPQAPSYFNGYRSESISSTTSLSSSMTSPKVWPSPTLNQSGQFRNDSVTPIIPEGQELQHDWLSTPTEPLFTTKPKQRTLSVDTVDDGSCIKMKVYFENDIFALKFKKNIGIMDVKQSIAKRLETEVGALRLYYKNPVKNYFSPLVDDMDVDAAFEQSKVSVKVHIWDNKI